MSPLVAMALALPWGAAAAWLWLRGMRRTVSSAIRRSTALGAARVLARVVLTAALIIAPAFVEPVAVVGVLGGFIVTRNVMLFRETSHAR